MAILNLQKGSVLDLSKSRTRLSKLMLGAGWDVVSNGPSADLDISAFLLTNNRLLNPATGVVFFNQMQQQGISLTGDNRTGIGEGDDEQILVDLDALDSNVNKIVFYINIFEAKEKRQTFGMVKNAYIRLVNTEENEELCSFQLTDNYSSSTAVLAVSLEKVNNDWHFKAIGEGLIGDLNDICLKYM